MGRQTTEPLPELSPRATSVLQFLFLAHPLALPTRTLARAWFAGTAGTASTIEKRAWRFLTRLKTIGLVAATPAPTTEAGRSQSYWHLLPAGIAWLVSEGVVSSRDAEQKPKLHESPRTLVRRRRHDLYVAALAAEVHFFARSAGVPLRFLRFDRSTWSTVPGTEGDIMIAPDLVAVVELGSPVVIFAEVQGTAPELEAVAEKTRGYLAWLRSGEAEVRYAAKLARVLFCAFSDHADGGADHAHNILDAAADAGGGRLVLAATMKAITEQGLGAPAWRRASDLTEFLRSLPEPLRARFSESRHAGNAVRADRDQRLATAVPLRRFYE